MSWVGFCRGTGNQSDNERDNKTETERLSGRERETKSQRDRENEEEQLKVQIDGKLTSTDRV